MKRKTNRDYQRVVTMNNKLKISSVDLERHPRLGAHFSRINGRGKSEKMIIDGKLQAHFSDILEAYATEITNLSDTEAVVYLSERGLTHEDFQLSLDVVRNPEGWDRSTPDVDALYTALAEYGDENASDIRESA